jgi:hypothetical protein
VADEQDRFEQLLDVLVYAPLGLVLSARDLVPTLAERGRRHLGPQATAARMVGEMAVSQGQRGVEHLVRRGRTQAEQLLSDVVGRAAALAGDGDRRPPGDHVGTGTTVAPPPPSSGSPPPATAARAPAAQRAPEVADLAIPGYDTLSASQVVQRLEGLTPGQLEAVRSYEEAGRARKTVLSRIAQLMAR